MNEIEKSQVSTMFKDTFDIIKGYMEKRNGSYELKGLEFTYISDPCDEAESFYDSVKKCYNDWVFSGVFSFDHDILNRINTVYGILSDSDDKSRETFNWFIKYSIARTLTNDDIAVVFFPFPISKRIIFNCEKYAAENIIKAGDLFKVNGYLIDSEFDILSETWAYRNYFLEGRCEPGNGDFVIDAGAYLGETAMWFADIVGADGKVFAFEIIDSHIDTIRENIRLNELSDIIQLVNKGLWDENISTKAKVDNAGSSCAYGAGLL